MSKNLTAKKQQAYELSMQTHDTRYYILIRERNAPIIESDCEQIRSKLADRTWYLEGCYVNGVWEEHQEAIDGVFNTLEMLTSASKLLEAAYKSAFSSSLDNPGIRYYILTHRIYRPVILTLEWVVKHQLNYETWNLKGSYMNGQFNDSVKSWDILSHRRN